MTAEVYKINCGAHAPVPLTGTSGQRFYGGESSVVASYESATG